MSNQEKWVQLFETVHGRKPSPAEFVAGKTSGFDFKIIKQLGQSDEGTVPVVEGSQSEPIDQAEPVVPTVPTVTEGVVPPQVTYVPTEMVAGPVKTGFFQSPKKKWGLLAVALVGLAAVAYVYLDQTTGPAVAVERFTTHLESKNYADLAKVLSTDQVTWESEDAKEFIEFLQQKEVDIPTAVSQFKNDPTKVITDEKGNQLLGLAKVSDIAGFFPSYEVVSYPLEYQVKTSVAGLEIDGKKIEANKELSLGLRPFAASSFNLTGNTDTGKVDVSLSGNLDQAANNKLLLTVQPLEKPFRVKLPVDSSVVKNILVTVGGQEVKNTVDAKVKVLENQQVPVKARFDFEGVTYQTEEKTVSVQSGDSAQEVELAVSSSDMEQLKKAQAALETKKKEEAEKAAKFEAEKSKITSFMQEYIQVVDNSIRNHVVEFSHYHDTNAYFHKELVDFANSQSNRVGRTRDEFTVTDIKQEGADYIVYVRSRFTDHFRDGNSRSQNQSQTYLLKPNGSSYIIADKDY